MPGNAGQRGHPGRRGHREPVRGGRRVRRRVGGRPAPGSPGAPSGVLSRRCPCRPGQAARADQVLGLVLADGTAVRVDGVGVSRRRAGRAAPGSPPAAAPARTPPTSGRSARGSSGWARTGRQPDPVRRRRDAADLVDRDLAAEVRGPRSRSARESTMPTLKVECTYSGPTGSSSRTMSSAMRCSSAASRSRGVRAADGEHGPLGLDAGAGDRGLRTVRPPRCGPRPPPSRRRP